MIQCSFENLVQYLDGHLDLDHRLDVLDHLDRCDNCREAIYHISRDRDSNFFVTRPYRLDKVLAK